MFACYQVILTTVLFNRAKMEEIVLTLYLIMLATVLLATVEGIAVLVGMMLVAKKIIL